MKYVLLGSEASVRLSAEGVDSEVGDVDSEAGEGDVDSVVVDSASGVDSDVDASTDVEVSPSTISGARISGASPSSVELGVALAAFFAFAASAFASATSLLSIEIAFGLTENISPGLSRVFAFVI